MPTPLREVESTPVRQHMFGNPFKIEKRMMVDEADIDLVGGGSPQARGIKRLTDGVLGAPKPKRKPGPLPKDFCFKRPKSPSPLQYGNYFASPVIDAHEKKTSDQKQEIKQVFVDEEVVVSQESPTVLRNYVTNHIDLMSIKENEEIPVCQRNGNVHNYYDSKTAEKNSLLRAKLFKEVRKPGRDFSGVFSHLNNFNVGMPTKLFMVREMIHEAGRFKKKV
ncbi:integrator complex subunit 6-like [Tachypleus tridentatus]|uniref:integrator complex subunit 6-like n=1 Tax=Tachypleus tridentatus TaxID=6853 RepID=UPI003FD0A232